MNFDKYKNDLPWVLPYEEREKMSERFNAIEASFVGTKAEHEALRSKHKQEQKDADVIAKKAYKQREQELEEMFWHDLFEELGIPLDHPKADVFKRIAWDKGHSCGFSEVYNEACNLVELLEI